MLFPFPREFRLFVRKKETVLSLWISIKITKPLLRRVSLLSWPSVGIIDGGPRLGSVTAVTFGCQLTAPWWNPTRGLGKYGFTRA